MKKRLIISIAVPVVLLILAGLLYLYFSNKDTGITDFEDCAKKYPVMESYPERCMTPDGKSYTKKYPQP